MPSQAPEPKSVSAVGMPWTIDVPPVYQFSMPITTDDVPSVVISALTPNVVTTKPLTTPITAPTRMPTRMPTISDWWYLAYADAASTELSPATEPTDRSNWPHTSGTIEPSAMMASTVWLPTMLRMLSGWM